MNIFRIIIPCAAILICMVQTHAAEPPATPFVRINTEMHSGRIQNTATDRDEKLLATVSTDKTLKIWDRLSGKLIKTIRPPIADGYEGQLNGVALSPDGNTVATGGPTGETWDGSYCVYLFDIKSGEMKLRLKGFPKSVYRLAYSRDGKRLAVGLGYGKGIRIFSTTDGSLLFSDTAFEGNVFGMVFDSKGNLFATTDKGIIKRISPDGSLTYNLHSDRGKKIYSVSLSPDESLVALGYNDKPAVEIRYVHDGAVAFELNDPKGNQTIARFWSIAWSTDGSHIMAAGSRSDNDGKRFVCTWSTESKTVDERIAVPFKANISQLLSFRDGTVLYISFQGGFGLKDQKNRTVYRNPIAHPDFFISHNTFRISPDATHVQFSYERNDQAKAHFDLMKRRLVEGAADDGDLLPPRFTGNGINVSNWDATAEPRLNGSTIKGLYQRETSWGLAVRHDDKGFILGTDRALRSYDKNGRLLWMRQVPALACDVALSGDDRTVVAAFDDGTIRWYNSEDGKEQYAIYLHPDRKRWILWMPDGYFDHGPESEKLILFHVNKGADKTAEIVSIDQMYDLFYRPDIIDRAIAGKEISPYIKQLGMLTAGRTFVAKSDDKTIDDKRGRSIKIPDKPASAVKIADINVQKSIKQVEREKEPYPAELSSDYDDNASDDQAQTGNSAQVSQQTMLDGLINSSTLPPRVRFITTSGEVGTSDVNLIAELCDNGGGIGDVTLFLNGIPITIDNNGRGLKAYPKNSLPGCLKFERTITLNNDRNFISLMAFNKGNTIESNRDNIELTTTLSAIKQPKLHILTVAVNNYQDGDLRLKYPLNDALDIDNTVRHHAESLFSKIITYTLHDKEVTKNNMAAVFSKIGATTNREDVFLLFLAGHGVTDEKSGIYYFLPVDFRYTGDDAVTSQGISMNDFKKYLTSINAMKSLILLDTCNSGSFTEAISSRGMTEKTAITKLTRAVGRATIAASSKNQVALEGYEGHGVFSYALLEGIKGKAASPDGQITINRLATFIEETLPLLTYKKWGYEQIPQKSLIGTDFQIGVK